MAFLLVVGAMFVGWAWEGFVLKILWGWFMVPLFGLPVLTTWWALGLAAVVGLFQHPPAAQSDPNAEPAEKVGAGLWLLFGRPGFYLLFGWIVTLFAGPLP